MSIRKLIALTLVLGLLLPAIAAAAPLHSAPLRDFVARPCAPGTSYDPACDVDHDGDVDIFDIQKAAGHWNQSGTWVSDNDHDHLGQVWTGNGNPLVINGSFGLPTLAPLALSNSLGYGLSIPSSGLSSVSIGAAGTDGVFVNTAGSPSASGGSSGSNGFEVAGAQGNGLYVGRSDGSGVRVASAGLEGVSVNAAGLHGVGVYSANVHGFYVDSAGADGLYVGHADGNGVRVESTGADGVLVFSAYDDGVNVTSAGNDGLLVVSAGGDGLEVRAAGDSGIDATGINWAGYFEGNIFVAGSCFGCSLATYAVNVGDRSLAPGDVVALAGLQETGMDTGPLLLEVVPASAGLPLVGVMSGRAELAMNDDPQPGETGQRLVPRGGRANPGQYVTVVYSGPMQVKVAAGESAIAAGTRLTVAANGSVRPLETRTVDGMVVTEGAPVIGVALEAAKDGLVWVLVNPQ